MRELIRTKIYRPTEGGSGNGAGDGSDIEFNGNRPVTRNTPGMVGITPGGNNLKAFLENLIYPAVAPIANLSIDRPTREIGENPAYTLTWSVVKKTNPISSIIVDGQGFTVTGVDQNGTKTGTFPQTTGTHTRSMTVSDGMLSDSKSVTVTYLPRMLWGTTTKSSGITDADILALSGSELRADFLKSFSNFGGGGTRLIFVVPQIFGMPSFKINGLANTAFTVVRSNSMVNQHGANIPVFVVISDNIYNSQLDSLQIVA